MIETILKFSILDTNYTGEEVDSEQEMDNYLYCVVALHRMMLIEQSLMHEIIPSEHQPRVFELVIREAMDVIVQDGENIVARAKRCLNRHDFASVLVIFSILKQLLVLKPEFESTIEKCDENVKSKFGSIIKKLNDTVS